MGINYTPATFVAGTVVTAPQLNTEIRDLSNGIQAAWTTFTPTLTAATANPTGVTYTGSAYMRIGKTVHFRANITIGAATGTGAYSIDLPVTPKAGCNQIVHGTITDFGTGVLSAVIRFNGTLTAPLLVDPSTAGAVLRAATQTVPITFGVSDTIDICGTYEAA